MGSLYGYEIDADRPLARLSDARGERGRISVRENGGQPVEEAAELSRLITDPDWNPQYVAGRMGERIVIWHADAGTFLLDPSSLAVAHRASDTVLAAGPARWEDRLASSAIPQLLGAAGGVPLHAAANRVGDRALVICGVTGRGKSTLCAVLAAAGHPSLGEDGVVLFRAGERFAVWPGTSGSLITEAAGALIGASTDGPSDPRGRRLHAGFDSADGPAEVAAVAFLRERGGPAVEIQRVDTAKTHRELLDHLLAAKPLGAREFGAAARIAESVTGLLLRVPDSLDAAVEAADRLAELFPGETG